MGEALYDAFQHEILAEKAASLGRAGDNAARAMARLHACEKGSPERPAALKEAAGAVHAWFIQREICGLRRHQDVIRELRIPQEVLVRLGAS
jgi:hypothetical protein